MGLPEVAAIYIGLAAWIIILLGHEPWYLVDDSTRRMPDRDLKLKQYRLCKIIYVCCLSFLSVRFVAEIIAPSIVQSTFLLYLSAFVLTVFYSLIFVAAFLIIVLSIDFIERKFMRYM